MRSTRRSSIVAESSAVNSSTGDTKWRRILAMFLADASSALVSDSAFPDSDPYFYLLQSNGRNSLCLLTGLDVETYSALLLECKLVQEQ